MKFLFNKYFKYIKKNIYILILKLKKYYIYNIRYALNI